MADVIITARLLPGVKIGDGFISVEPLDAVRGRPMWKWYIDLPDGRGFTGADLGGPRDAGDALASMMGFLSAAVESARYERATGHPGECSALFPAPVVEWAEQHEYGLIDLEEA
jgi:hypothetical protein